MLKSFFYHYFGLVLWLIKSNFLKGRKNDVGMKQQLLGVANNY